MKKRYSIENFILDPLLIVSLLLKLGFNETINIDTSITFLSLEQTQQNDLQKFVNNTLNKVAEKVGSKLDLSLVECKYVGKFSLELPKWFLNINGHNLEATIKEAFPQLSRYHNENDLKNEIVKNILRELPCFTPIEFLETFQKIQNLA